MDTNSPHILTEQSPPYAVGQSDAVTLPPDAPQTTDTTQVQPTSATKRNRFDITTVSPKFSPEQARAASRARWERSRAIQTSVEHQNVTEGTQSVLQGTLSQTERENLIREYKDLAAMSRKQLMTLTDPKDRHQEASTLAKLEACYWRYAGIPGEGTLKPTTAKPRDRRMEGLGPVG